MHSIFRCTQKLFHKSAFFRNAKNGNGKTEDTLTHTHVHNGIYIYVCGMNRNCIIFFPYPDFIHPQVTDGAIGGQ